MTGRQVTARPSTVSSSGLRKSTAPRSPTRFSRKAGYFSSRSSKFRELEILPNEARSGPGALTNDQVKAARKQIVNLAHYVAGHYGTEKAGKVWEDLKTRYAWGTELTESEVADVLREVNSAQTSDTTKGETGVRTGPSFNSELVVVEGEFKATSLCDASFRAVGIGGISSAMKRVN